MSKNLQIEEIVEAELVGPSTESSQIGRQSFVERLLSPRSLGVMMTSGGGLLVTGIVVWLWSIGVFENSLTVAITAGSANLFVLGFGLWLYKTTRYKIAGRGLTLLSSMVLPLNLWLYESQELISMNEGGQLWIPALLCCVIYAIVARITRDSLFVYSIVGGIVMTGTLFLAGAPQDLFWSALPIATFLVAVGTVCIHLDRLFPKSNGDFSRDNFGRAFSHAGHLVLAGSLALLLGSQFADFVTNFLSIPLSNFYSPKLLGHSYGKIWTIGILAVAASTYWFCSFTDRKQLFHSLMAALTTVWAGLVIIELCNITITLNMGLLILGVLIVLANILQTLLPDNSQYRSHSYFAFGAVAALLLLSNALVRFFGGLLFDETFFLDWVHVGQLAAATSAVFSLPGIHNRGNSEKLDAIIFVGASGLMLTILTTVFGFGFENVALVLVALASIPLLVSIVAFLAPDSYVAERCHLVTVAFSIVPMICWLALLTTSSLVGFATIPSISMMAIISASCSLASFATGKRIGLIFGVIALTISLAQLAVYFDLVNAYAIITTISLTGLLNAAVGRWSKHSKIFDIPDSTLGQMQPLGNSLICIGAAGAFLFVAFALLGSHAVPAHLGLLAIQLISIAAGAAMAKESAWRSAFLVSATATIGITVFAVVNLSTLTIFQRIEIGSLVLGALMVVVGFIGWSRENGEQDDVVSFNLIAGSWILVIPLVVGIVADRMDANQMIDAWRYLHEIGGLAIGLILLGMGIICQIRSSTLSGGALLGVFIFSNVLLINIPEQLQSTSVLMMIGGALFFATAVLLSIYRDKIIGLPEKIREGKGIFRVLKWR